jgi:hypothetical protein
MISKETAARIWDCYREIEIGEKLIADMTDALKRGEDANPRDPFGTRRCLQLGVPNESNGHRLFDVQPTLAVAVIRAHVAAKQSELEAANEQARIEAGEVQSA